MQISREQFWVHFSNATNMVSRINFIWPEKNINETLESVNFSVKYSEKIGNCHLFSAELDPPMNVVKRIHRRHVTFRVSCVIGQQWIRLTRIN